MISTREIAAEHRLAHWAGIMQERGASGLSIRAYCETKGIHKNAYFYWQRKLRKVACKKLLPEKQTQENYEAPMGWAKCRAAEPEEKEYGGISVEIGSFKVTVKSENDMNMFAKVCQVLMPLC